MFSLSKNYQLRRCFLEREQVPTQSMIRKTMSPALADVYFKSMNPKVKVLAGLEPPMKGAGADWYIPPREILLEGRVVLKPTTRKLLGNLTCYGVDDIGTRLIEVHRNRMMLERNRLIDESDSNWTKKVKLLSQEEWAKCSADAINENTKFLQAVFREFSNLYTGSINAFQDLLFEAAVSKIKESREQVFEKMQNRYEQFLHQQANMLYDRYTKKLNRKKDKIKNNFSKRLDRHRARTAKKIHDLNVEKHAVVEKSRQFLECRNLACQVYVALKEREECAKEMELSKHRHVGTMTTLTEMLQLKDFEIRLAVQKEIKRDEFIRIWQQKVCHVVKHFQMFVSYCLNMLPEHAEFFINMEKLMLLQLNEALENPSSESIFVPDVESFHTPKPKAHPFYLFCDERHKTPINQDLCPKHCTSSASQLPVIVINKRCIYAACDNFEQYTDKIRGYIYGKCTDYADFVDDHDYTVDIPVQCTSSQQLKELKLESSLLQVLQQEISNLRDLPLKCVGCDVTHCFDCDKVSPLTKQKVQPEIKPDKQTSIKSVAPDTKISHEVGLKHEREPKWDSYSQYLQSKKCACAKTAKKYLLDNLPPYMRNMSCYDEPKLPNYEKCPVTSLKALVEMVRNQPKPIPSPPRVPSKTREMSTQYSDDTFNYLCSCYSDENIEQFIKNIIAGVKGLSTKDDHFEVVGDSCSRTYLTKASVSFATARAASLRHLVDQSPDIKEIFKNQDCIFD